MLMRYKDDFRSGQDYFGHYMERYKLRIKDYVANGEACRFYETGAQAHCYYKNGRLEGIFTYAVPGRPILCWTFKEGLFNGAAIEYIEEGLCSCRYKMGIKTGKATVTMTDGTSIEFSYNQGIRQGKAVMLCNDRSRIEFTYINDKPSGPAIQIFEDGSKDYFHYIDGHKVQDTTF